MYSGGDINGGWREVLLDCAIGFGVATGMLTSIVYLTRVENSVTGRVISVETMVSSTNQPLAESIDASGIQSVQMASGRNYLIRVNDGVPNSNPYAISISRETSVGIEPLLSVGTCVKFSTLKKGKPYFNQNRIGELGLDQITTLPPDQCGKK